MKAKQLAEMLLRHPEADVFVTQTMHFESLAHEPADPVTIKERTYLFMRRGVLGHNIPEVAKEIWKDG